MIETFITPSGQRKDYGVIFAVLTETPYVTSSEEVGLGQCPDSPGEKRVTIRI